MMLMSPPFGVSDVLTTYNYEVIDYRYGRKYDLPPMTKPVGVRVELRQQKQLGVNSPNCYADGIYYTAAATLQ